jgi:hypothetical protein
LINDDNLDLVTRPYAETAEISTAVSSKISESVEVMYANGFFGDVWILMSRSILNVLRTPELFFARVGASIGFGVLIGTLFLNTEDTVFGLDHRLAYFVFTIAFYYYTSLEALPIFLAEREIFQREYSRGAYRATAYTVASSLVLFPFLLLMATVYCVITWWLVGLPNIAQAFFFHIFCVFTILVAGSSFATMISVIVPNPMVRLELSYFQCIIGLIRDFVIGWTVCGIWSVLSDVFVFGIFHQKVRYAGLLDLVELPLFVQGNFIFNKISCIIKISQLISHSMRMNR